MTFLERGAEGEGVAEADTAGDGTDGGVGVAEQLGGQREPLFPQIGQTYELTGPRLMTFADTVEEIARATGHDLRYVPLTAQAFADEQRAYGVPDAWVHVSLDLYEHVRDGRLATLTDDVRRLLGRPARNFTDYARDAAAEGAWRT